MLVRVGLLYDISYQVTLRTITSPIDKLMSLKVNWFLVYQAYME